MNLLLNTVIFLCRFCRWSSSHKLHYKAKCPIPASGKVLLEFLELAAQSLELHMAYGTDTVGRNRQCIKKHII